MVIRQRVTAQFFADPEQRAVFSWIVNHYQKYGSVPSLVLLKEEFDDYEPLDTDDDILMLVDKVKERKLYSDIQAALVSIVEETRSNPRDGLNILKARASSLAAVHSDSFDLDLSQATDEIRNEYERLKEGGGTVGIPYPWERLNQATLGMHDGELIGIYARPKCMKTWISLFMAENIHSTWGKVPVFFTKEMPPEQIRRRWAAMRAKLNYSAFREGKLTEAEEKRFYEMLEQIRDEPPFLVTTIDGTGYAALTEVKAKCEEYNADFAIVDGLYFLAEDPSWKAFSVVTRGLKDIARSLKIPMIATTQANRGAEKTRGQGTTEVAFGDSLAQDVDVLIRLIREGQHRENDEVMITLPALRESKGCTFTIHAMPAENFTQKFAVDNEGETLAGTDEGAIL
jgi:replicative DNA helicase